MPNPSKSLVNAILDDDRARVKVLLKVAPQLSTEPVEKARLAWELPHWIYVCDTPLHVAAAGYRVEIARGTTPGFDCDEAAREPLAGRKTKCM